MICGRFYYTMFCYSIYVQLVFEGNVKIVMGITIGVISLNNFSHDTCTKVVVDISIVLLAKRTTFADIYSYFLKPIQGWSFCLISFWQRILFEVRGWISILYSKTWILDWGGLVIIGPGYRFKWRPPFRVNFHVTLLLISAEEWERHHFSINISWENVGKRAGILELFISNEVTIFQISIDKMFRIMFNLWMIRDSSIQWLYQKFIFLQLLVIQMRPSLIRYLWSRMFFQIVVTIHCFVRKFHLF